MPTTVLIAFDKFKDALTAEAACAIAAAALPAELPYVLRPLTDGGEGFVTALLTALGGRVRHQTVTGPLGDPVTANWGSIGWSALPEAARKMLDLPNSVAFTPSARIAFVEAASTCGLMQVPAERRNPAETSSAGLGQILRHVTEADIVAIVIGLGGSATNDLGLGALAELGLTCHDSTGRPITPPVPQRWAAITELRGEILPSLPHLRIACDVTNPLHGPRGASAVFGPQKGLPHSLVQAADHAMARLAGLLAARLNIKPSSFTAPPGAGAAGGIAAGLLATGRAQLMPGFDFVSACLALDEALDRCSIVLTGEGRFDASSLEGKGPGSLVSLALARTKRVLVIAGAGDFACLPPGVDSLALSPPDLPLPQALAETAKRLERAVRLAFMPGATLPE